jgi:DNA polymerase-3 subunit epsilon/CBS domain-containing protein
MVLGSAGRGESLLAMDQDNAIIYDGEGDAWLAAMANRMNAVLDEIGVPLCKGGVMAKSENWRRSGEAWRRHVSGWLSRSDPKDILNADIFFDALPVHGDAQMAEDLRRDAIAAAMQSPGFLKLMTMNAAAIEPSIGWFGRFKLDEDGRMDLKRGGILPIFSCARVLALRHGLPVRSTAARLEALRGRDDIPQRQLEQILEAHRILLGVILNQQLLDIQRGTPPSSRVDPKDVLPSEKDRLKWALDHVKAVIDLLGDPIG